MLPPIPIIAISIGFLLVRYASAGINSHFRQIIRNHTKYIRVTPLGVGVIKPWSVDKHDIPTLEHERVRELHLLRARLQLVADLQLARSSSRVDELRSENDINNFGFGRK